MSQFNIDQAMQTALGCLRAGQFAEAEKLYRQVLALNANHADALHFLGLLAAQTGRLDSAVQLVEQAIAIDPSNAGYHCNLGKILTDQRRFDEAVAACRQALRFNPQFPEACNNLGAVLREQGKLDEAVAAYREALRFRPDFPEVYFNLGNALNEQRKFDEAAAACAEAVRLKPDYALAYNSLGNAQRGKNDVDKAAVAYSQALRLQPQLPDVHNNMGIVLKALGKLDQATAAFQTALRLRPDYPEAGANLGQTFLTQNRLDEAVAAFSKVIALKPEFAWGHNNLGNALSKMRRFDEALVAYRRAAELNPDLAEAYNGIGNMLRQTSQFGDAIAAYLTAIRLQPDFINAYVNLGQVFYSTGRFEEALSAYRQALKPNDDAENLPVHAQIAVILAELRRFDEALASHARMAALSPNAAVTSEVLGEIMLQRHDAPGAVDQFRRAVALDPKLDTAWKGLGSALQSLGKFDEAAKCFRRMLELCPDPAVGLVYRHLLETGEIAAEQTDIDRLTALLNAPNIPPHSRIAAGFALGKILDEAGRFDEAFARYAEANSLDKQLLASVGERYDPERVHRQIDQMIDTFTPEFFQQRRDWGEPSDLPVFIVGMPRSGTTLVHQIAASHPRVHGAGELNDIARIVKSLGGTDLKSAALSWDRDAIKRAADRHLQHLRSMDGTALRIVDKMPSNIHRLELISLLYPAARVIFCHREVRDNCLSCYFQWFSSGNAYAYDLAHCGHEYLATDRLMAHWRRVLPLPMLEVQYEDLVADLEGQSRRLIDFLGLPWDPACLEFHRAETTVLTASAWQVRQPIYQSSVGRWRHYERHLGPLMEVLNGQKQDGSS